MSAAANAAASLLSGLMQADRLLTLTTPLGRDVLLLERFTGSEGISQPFRFHLSMVAPAATGVPFEKLLGQSVTVELALANGGPRYWNGVMTQFGLAGPVLDQGQAVQYVRYRGVLAPRLGLLRKRVQCRVFHQQSVPHIVESVLKALPGLDLNMQVQTFAYPAREYVVQYRESDLAFISRLLEEEGIYYYFTHTDKGHQLVITDSTDTHPVVTPPAPVVYDPTNLAPTPRDPRVRRFTCSQRLQSSKFTLWDYSYELADSNLGAAEHLPESVKVGDTTYKLRPDGVADLENFQYPGNYAHHFDGIGLDGREQLGRLQSLHRENARKAKLRMQARAARALWAKGTSNCGHFLPGHQFSLSSRWAAPGPYLLTTVRHHAVQEGVWRSQAGTVVYRNGFRCIPQAVPYRPSQRTPKPRIHGTQSAVVVGPPKQDVFTDKYGRVKVQFFWDRDGVPQRNGLDGQDILTFKYWSGQGQAADPPLHSRWVRVAQGWAGQGWGEIAVPRIGREVLVGYVEGDPDQPIILGSVYNSLNMPPFTLPEHALASGVKTQTAGGDSNQYNGLAFNDTKGKENAQLQAQRNLILNAKQDMVTNVGGNYFENIVGTRLKYTGQPPALGDTGDPKGKGNEAWNWKVGDVSAAVGKSLSMVFGEETKAVAGLSASLTLGNKMDLLINPFVFLNRVPALAPVTAALSPLLNLFVGRNEYILGQKSEFVYSLKSSVVMNNKADYAPAPADHAILRGFVDAAALLTAAEWLWLGGAGQHLAQGWDESIPTAAMTVLGGGIGLLAMGVIAEVSRVMSKAKALQDAATAAKNAASARSAANAAAAAAAGTSAAATVTALAANPVATQYKMDSYAGPMLGKYSDYQLIGHNSVLIVAGGGNPTGRPPVNLPATAKNTIVMDPILGLTLSNGDPAIQAKIQLGPTACPTPGIKISVTGAEIKLDPITGITLSCGTGPLAQSIELNPAGTITLTSGAGLAARTIMLSALGITLAASPPPMGGKISLQSEGITMDGGTMIVEPQTSYMIHTANLTESVTGTYVSRAAVRQVT